MARLPIMPVFTDALVGDTLHLTAEQFGCYALILIATWRNNGQALADDDKRLAQIARVSLARWRTRIRPVLVEFFDLSDGHWHQKRLEIEWQKALEKSGKQRARRAGKGQQTLPFDATAVEPRINRASTSAVVEPRRDYPEEATLPTKDSPSVSNPESVAASAAVDKKDGGNPWGSLRSPCRRDPPRSPELKAKIKRQLAAKHWRFLRLCGRPGESDRYRDEMLAGEGGLPEQRYFDEIDARMRASNWDDMRWWRELKLRPKDLAAAKAADPFSAENLLLRQGWFHGKAA